MVDPLHGAGHAKDKGHHHKVAKTFMEVNIGLNGNIVHMENIITILHVGQNNIKDDENKLEIQEIIHR